MLELASVLAGPSVGQFFAELGAHVIKVENPKVGGDVTRSWKFKGEKTDDRSAYFSAINWGKQSIALDISTSQGLDVARHLSAKADIVIASFKPGDAEKLGVDYGSLSKDHPQLIYGQITGYGSADPRVGYDAIIQAEAGFMFLNGEAGSPSLKMPVALVDILAGHHLKEGLLLAMLERLRTGRGQLVQVSLIEAAVASLANQASNFLVGGAAPQKHGSSHPNIAPYGDVFTTLDGKEILLAIGTDKQFEVLCNVLNIINVAQDKLFGDNQARVRHRVELNTILAQTIGRLRALPLLEKLALAKVPAGAVRSIPEVMDDPAIANLFLSSGDLKGLRTYSAHSGDSLSSHLLPPPKLGEHTDAILEQMLNYSPTAAKKLRDQGVIS